jgi:hypothetical protein
MKLGMPHLREGAGRFVGRFYGRLYEIKQWFFWLYRNVRGDKRGGKKD